MYNTKARQNTTRKLSYRVLNRSDQTNNLIVIMSKENGNVAVKIKTTIDRSPVVTGVFRNFHRNSYYNCQHPVHQLLPFRGKKLSEEKIVYDNKTYVGKQNHLT